MTGHHFLAALVGAVYGLMIGLIINSGGVSHTEFARYARDRAGKLEQCIVIAETLTSRLDGRPATGAAQ